jgi:hypothetical protein
MITLKNKNGVELEIADGSHVAVDGSFAEDGDEVDVFREWGEMDHDVRAEVVAIQGEAERLLERVKELVG